MIGLKYVNRIIGAVILGATLRITSSTLSMLVPFSRERVAAACVYACVYE